jgi:hypothetical protein
MGLQRKLELWDRGENLLYRTKRPFALSVVPSFFCGKLATCVNLYGQPRAWGHEAPLDLKVTVQAK